MKLFSQGNAPRSLTPLVPYVPRTFPTPLPWRQELWLALLLTVTFALLLKRLPLAKEAKPLRVSFSRGELYTLALLALFVLWVAASTLWSESGIHAINQTLKWVAYLLFFFLLYRVTDQARLFRASMIVLAMTIWIVGIANMIEFWGSTAVQMRYLLGLGEPTAVVVPLFVALALSLRRGREAALCGATAGLAWLTTLQSFERAPLMGSAIALALMAGFILAWKRFRPRYARRSVVMLLILIGVTALQSVPSPLTQGFPSAITRINTTGANESNTSVRLLFWGAGLEMLYAHPFTGVGAGNYEVAFAAGRRDFVTRYPDSPLVGAWEERMPERAHNTYVQVLAELGVVGLAFFVAFGAALAWQAKRALQHARNPMLVLGACGSLLAFAVSSGASPISFNWLGSGLVFFFAAAIVLRGAVEGSKDEQVIVAPIRYVRLATAGTFACALVLLSCFSMQAISSTLHGTALWGKDRVRSQQLYEAALRWNTYDPVNHYNYGIFLLANEQSSKGVPHLRYAVERGFNSSLCYGYLVTAEIRAGDLAAAERTLLEALSAYPHSIFLRVRYANVLTQLGKIEEGSKQYEAALSLNGRMARGWWHLVNLGLEGATAAARKDANIALPGELQPELCIFTVLEENKKPSAALDSPVNGLYLRAAKK
jgi:O-antigen ligase